MWLSVGESDRQCGSMLVGQIDNVAQYVGEPEIPSFFARPVRTVRWALEFPR